MVEDERPLTE